MKFLRKQLDRIAPLFEKGGKFEKFYPAYEALDTFFYSPGSVTSGPTHVRDGMDLKRTMIVVVVALIPCCLMAMYNTGLQANTAICSVTDASELDLPWQASLMQSCGGSTFSQQPPVHVS